MFYWLILIILIFIVIRFKISGQKILYFGLIILAIGAIFGNFVLGCGLILMTIGVITTLNEKK